LREREREREREGVERDTSMSIFSPTKQSRLRLE
jgi:hypothetical protein